MKDNFALAVENSTASFINQNQIRCGNAQEQILDIISQDSKTLNGDNCVILCYENGWFEGGMQLKSKLSEGVVSFCIESEERLNFSATTLLNTVKKIDYLIVIGDEDLAVFGLNYCKERGGKVIYFPLDTSFLEYFSAQLSNQNAFLILDENVIKKCGKNRLTDGVRMVLSKKLLFVEMAVNEVIAGLLPKNEAKKALNDSVSLIYKYLNSHNVEDLVCAMLLSQIGENLSLAGNVSFWATKILFKLERLSLKGEAQYLFYKMALRSYELYLKNDTSFTLQLGGIALEEDEINKLFISSCEKVDCSLPPYFNDLEAVKNLKQKVLNSATVLTLIQEQLSQIESDELSLKKEYGGRKYTVEHYNAKQRSKALMLAPYLTKKPCAYDLLFACGFTQYYK